ncbi:MAG: UDP-glucose 4-epimerase GalE [Lentisphaerae bacterium]|nr:UDP-glucose 4-epimerase GalE [Lentisphaerota bacterium]
MRVFVTGGAGYIGSVTTELLLDQGNEVVVFDNFSRGHREAVDPRARLIEGDLCEAGEIAGALADARPDAVMHFAAFALVGESMTQPELYYGNNVVGGLNLLEGMRKAGVGRLVFSSTCATYGQPEKVPITEETPQSPTNPYGESKLVLEKAIGWYGRIHGLRGVCLRYFNASGATLKYGEDHDPETHLIPLVLKVALGQRPEVQIFGDDYDTPDGTCLRDYIHIVDLARAHILALEKDVTGAFNLGTGTGNSVREIIEAAREVTGRKIPEKMVARRPGDPARLVAAASRARQQLGWEPGYKDVRAIIECAWKWHLAHPNGYSGSGA